jgi:hypothetical protein
MIEGRRRPSPAGDAGEDRRAARFGLLAAHDHQAAAPSLRPDALPAVTVPSFLKAGRRAAERRLLDSVADIFVAVDDRVALAALDGNRGDLVGEAALRPRRGGLVLEAAAKASCSSRVIWYFSPGSRR